MQEVWRPVTLCTHARSHSVVSDSLRPHGLEPSRLLCSWSFPGKSAGVGCLFLLYRIFPTQGSNPRLPCLPHWQVDSLPLSHCPLTGIQRPLPMMWVGTEWQEDSVLMGKWSIKLNRYLFIFGFHYNISQGFLNAWSQFSYTSSVNLSRTLFTKNLGDSVSQSAICRIPKTLTDPPGDKHANKQKPETDRSKLL